MLPIVEIRDACESGARGPAGVGAPGEREKGEGLIGVERVAAGEEEVRLSGAVVLNRNGAARRSAQFDKLEIGGPYPMPPCAY